MPDRFPRLLPDPSRRQTVPRPPAFDLDTYLDGLGDTLLMKLSDGVSVRAIYGFLATHPTPLPVSESSFRRGVNRLRQRRGVQNRKRDRPVDEPAGGEAPP